MFQQTILAGNLGRDPELRYTQDGKAVCNLSVAVNSGRDRTLWIAVATWEKLAEQCSEHLHKGDQVMVSGELSEPYAYTTDDGKPRARLEMVARVVRFGKRAATNGLAAPEVATESNIPF